MSIYVDQLRDWGWRLGPSCHLIADSLEELHRFAGGLGMKRAWFQPSPPASISHYDLTAKRRSAALKRGAIELSTRDFVFKIRQLRGAIL